MSRFIRKAISLVRNILIFVSSYSQISRSISVKPSPLRSHISKDNICFLFDNRASAHFPGSAQLPTVRVFLRFLIMYLIFAMKDRNTIVCHIVVISTINESEYTQAELLFCSANDCEA